VIFRALEPNARRRLRELPERALRRQRAYDDRLAGGGDDDRDAPERTDLAV
jgi:hypothetical protein